MLSIIFNKRYGFYDKDNNKYIGYIYKDPNSSRIFSVAKRINSDLYYINEIDETFLPSDNTYSILTAKTIEESKNIIIDILKGEVK